MLEIIRSGNERALHKLFLARQSHENDAEQVARRIIRDVRTRGDEALIRLTRRFDRIDLAREGFTVTADQIRVAHAATPRRFVTAVGAAARNIRATARRQLPKPWKTTVSPGIEVGQQVRPLDRVACYVPGGRFPLPSTVLMSVIPAQVAGVKEIFVTSPRPAAAVIVTADLLGVTRIFRLGGAQAIAAFAYGTASVPQADKIVGPGNRYVAAAKKLVAGDCGIDFVAGPTELVVVGAKGRAAWVAADLVAQAEHDPDASAILVTWSMKFALEVRKEVESILRRLQLPIAKASLSRQSAIILARNLDESISISNQLAPEHLTLLDDAVGALNRVRAAGAIFLGAASPVAAGDYASGGNHILPTAGAARVRGGLTAGDFVRCISAQRLTRRGLSGIRQTVVTLAKTEGLAAHAHSIGVRFEDDPRA